MSKVPQPKKNVPWWKKQMERLSTDTKVDRDSDGWPIFHLKDTCVRCNELAGTFSDPWYEYRFQVLGYCEPCCIRVMGGPLDPNTFVPPVPKCASPTRTPLQRPLFPDPNEVKAIEKVISMVA